MAESSPPKMRLWLRLVLIVSLGLNLAVAGVVAGAFLKDPPTHGRSDARQGVRLPSELRELGPVPFFHALSPEHRRLILDDSKTRQDDLGDSRAATAARLEEMLRVLRAETFDAGAMRTLMADQSAAAAARADIGAELLLARFAAMTVEERTAYADRLDRSLRRRPPKRP